MTINNLKTIIDNKDPNTLSDYLNLYKKVQKELKSNPSDKPESLKVALLSSFTINGLKEALFIKLLKIGILSDIYVGGYNQYNQEILNSKSDLYSFNPDIIFIFIDTKTILGEDYFLPYLISDNERETWLENTKNHFQLLVNKLKEQTTAKIIFHNFEVPVYSPLGILENKQNLGFKEAIIKLNLNLTEHYRSDGQLFIYDYENFCSNIGKKNLVNPKMYYMGDLKLDLQMIPPLAEEYLSYIKPLKAMTKKCIVLDLDNTLWGGIIGEDSIEGIKLGPTPEGRAFFEFQKYLLSLYNRGIILAINSKNNFEDAINVIRNHPNMILKETCFASFQINWNDKVSNMKSIAKELNIGLDSFIYFDDDKLWREIVSSSIPEILVVNMPEDPALYCQALQEINDLNTYTLTEEDKNKGKQYAQQRERQVFHQSATDLSDFLKGLQMVLTIEEANKFNIPRISQLTLKTNQFNMTTRRYQEEMIRNFAQDENYKVYAVQVEDKFGDNGITGVLIIKKDNHKWILDTFLLSCRIIGRRIEETILAYILDKAKQENVKELLGEFIQTKKNTPAKDFFSNNGFTLVDKIDQSEIWTYDVNKEFQYPDFIHIKGD